MKVNGLRIKVNVDLSNVDKEVVVPAGTAGTIDCVEEDFLIIDFDNGVNTSVDACEVDVIGIDTPAHWKETWPFDLYIDQLPNGHTLVLHIGRDKDKYTIVNTLKSTPDRRSVHHVGQDNYILKVWNQHKKGEY